MIDLSIFNNYLPKQNLYNFDYISDLSETDLIIVIPCHNETRLTDSLESLKKSSTAQVNLMIIVVINHGKDAFDTVVKTNNQTYDEACSWGNENCTKGFNLGLIKAYDLTRKKAGVGLARKIGMDKALSIFYKAQKEGLISCYDADSLCSVDYVSTIYKAFRDNPKVDGYSIYYEHPIEGNEFSSDVYEAIIQYEGHLRYFILMQKDLGLPFAYQTVGSSMAVKATSYAKFGGMNQRKAGEDFYFLQKFIENGRVMELNDTMIIPSPRISDRVPFGTGKAIGDLLADDNVAYFQTYHPNSFKDLIPFIHSIEKLYTEELDPIFASYKTGVQAFFETISFQDKILEARRNTSNFESFRRRIFKHFNAFQLMKYVHYSRDHHYPNISILEACRIRLGGQKSMKEYLLALRIMDRGE